jgi:hypothetical protein
MADNDLELALESALERLASLESRSGENSLDIAGLKKVDDGQQSTLLKFEDRQKADKVVIDQLRTEMIAQTEINQQQHSVIELLTRRLTAAESRLNGTAYEGLEPRATIEQMGDQLTGVKATLNGDRDGIAYGQVASIARGFQTTGNVIKGLGITTVIGIVGILGSSYFGWGKAVDLTGPFQLLEQRVEFIQKMAEETKSELGKMRDRELQKK